MQVTGEPVNEIVEIGWSDDGRFVHVLHKFENGSHLRLLYPTELIGFFLKSLEDAAGKAHNARVARNPNEATEGVFSAVVPIKEIRVGRTPEIPGIVFQCLSMANVPLSLGVPLDIVKQLAAGLPRVIDSAGAGPSQGSGPTKN